MENKRKKIKKTYKLTNNVLVVTKIGVYVRVCVYVIQRGGEREKVSQREGVREKCHGKENQRESDVENVKQRVGKNSQGSE